MCAISQREPSLNEGPEKIRLTREGGGAVVGVGVYGFLRKRSLKKKAGDGWVWSDEDKEVMSEGGRGWEN